MQVEDQKSRILKSSDWPKRYRNTERKGGRSTQLASTKKRQGSTKVPRSHQLL